MKDAKQLVKLFEKNGFTLHRMTNHMIWNCPCGHAQITAPLTPGGGNRSIDNTRARITRTRRQCTTTPQEDK